MSEVKTSEQTQDMRASWRSETLSPFEIEWAAGSRQERWRAALGKQGPIRGMEYPPSGVRNRRVQSKLSKSCNEGAPQ